MTKVLVTGAGGLLGSTLVPRLRERGHTVVGLSRTASDVRLDLTEDTETSVALDEIAPEVIVNLAAHTDVDDCERHPHLAYSGNVRIVESLAAWIRRGRGSCHLIQISTDQVYDGPGPHTEDDITLTNYYGFSKYAGELAAATVPSTILRTNMFGRSDCADRTSLSDWLTAALSQGDAITVFDDVLFSPLIIGHLSDVIESALAKKQVGTFNVGSREGMSKADFAFALADALRLPTKTMRRGTSSDSTFAAHRPGDMRMDSTRFEEAFGMQLPTLAEEIKTLQGETSNEAK